MNNFYKTQYINEQRILKVNPKVNHHSGIYVLFRIDEHGFKHAYIGQARDLLKRLGQHLNGYTQHIDLSLRKHKLFGISNPYGWNVKVYEFPFVELNEREREFIRKYANDGYQLKNVTLGGQDEGKENLNENKIHKGYREGVEYGRIKALKEVKSYFDKYLDIELKHTNKICERKKIQFEELLNENQRNIEDCEEDTISDSSIEG